MPELFEQGGYTFAAIFVLSLGAWALILWKWLHVRSETTGDMSWTEQALRHLRESRQKQALAICQQHDGMAARMLREAIQTDQPQRRFFEVHVAPIFASEQTRLRSHMDLIAVAASLSPLLGLLGTVMGMVATFRGITTGGSVEGGVMAAGISQALVTTQAGLVVALPIVLVHGYLNSRIQRQIDIVSLLIKKVETIVCND